MTARGGVRQGGEHGTWGNRMVFAPWNFIARYYLKSNFLKSWKLYFHPYLEIILWFNHLFTQFLANKPTISCNNNPLLLPTLIGSIHIGTQFRQTFLSINNYCAQQGKGMRLNERERRCGIIHPIRICTDSDTGSSSSLAVLDVSSSAVASSIVSAAIKAHLLTSLPVSIPWHNHRRGFPQKSEWAFIRIDPELRFSFYYNDSVLVVFSCWDKEWTLIGRSSTQNKQKRWTVDQGFDFIGINKWN